jgi:hypothetical protein
LIFVDPKAKKTADIFLGRKQIGPLNIPGTPCNIDAQGRLYFAEEERFPQVVRYTVTKN